LDSLGIPLFNILLPNWSHKHNLIDHFFISFALVVLLDRSSIEALQYLLHMVVLFLLLSLAGETPTDAQAHWASVVARPYPTVFVLRKARVAETVLTRRRVHDLVLRHIICHTLSDQFGSVSPAKANVLFVFCYLSFALVALENAERLRLAQLLVVDSVATKRSPSGAASIVLTFFVCFTHN
jgi:hypothetical protein